MSRTQLVAFFSQTAQQGKHRQEEIVAVTTQEKRAEARKRMLAILEKHGPCTPTEFARRMWPKSEGWQKYTKCGPKGTTRGGGMPLMAGGHLGRLLRKKLVRYSQNGYELSAAGRKELEALRG
jgi:hypothetical protein